LRGKRGFRGEGRLVATVEERPPIDSTLVPNLEERRGLLVKSVAPDASGGSGVEGPLDFGLASSAS